MEFLKTRCTLAPPESTDASKFRRKGSNDPRKLYHELLCKEIAGGNRLDEAQHAILDGDSSEVSPNVRSHALIHYLATLANSNKSDDTFDFEFVTSLLHNGADINDTDKSGQTIFHEVARSWNTEVARFLIEHGANVNHQDDFGRSPLHVAAAVDYAEMVEFLIQNGADAGIHTFGEQQTPMHYAAKNDAIKSLETLLGYKANVDARDGKNRTPLQVAAQMSRAKSAKFLVNAGAPVGVFDTCGNCALSLLIEKIPDVAEEALDQFHSFDSVNRKEYFFLNYLEGPRLNDRKSKVRTPLDIAVHHQRYDVILHPVMQRLIRVKWETYGKYGAVVDLFLNLAYAIVWTILGMKIPRHGRDLYIPLQTHVWRLIAGCVIVLFTLWEIKYQITNTVKSQRELKEWREWRAGQLEEDLEYCHPRWPQERQYLESEIKRVRQMSFISSSDWWLYFDWFALLLIFLTITTHVLFFVKDTDYMKELHHHSMIPLLMVLWFRIFKYARPFESAGPYIVIFSSVMGDIIKWLVLNSVILIPYTCAFWITFGRVSLHPVSGYDSAGPLCYNMFSMMVVGDHNFRGLVKANPILARLLCGSFIGVAAIVTVNLLIALLSNTFERLHENAVANAVMQRARTILLQEKTLRQSQRRNYYDIIRKKASPEVVPVKNRNQQCSMEERITIDRVHEEVASIGTLLRDRFGKTYGSDKKSDMDVVKEELGAIKCADKKIADDLEDVKIALKYLSERLVGQHGRCGHHDDDDDDTHQGDSNNSSMVRDNLDLGESQGSAAQAGGTDSPAIHDRRVRSASVFSKRPSITCGGELLTPHVRENQVGADAAVLPSPLHDHRAHAVSSMGKRASIAYGSELPAPHARGSQPSEDVAVTTASVLDPRARSASPVRKRAPSACGSESLAPRVRENPVSANRSQQTRLYDSTAPPTESRTVHPKPRLYAKYCDGSHFPSEARGSSEFLHEPPVYQRRPSLQLESSLTPGVSPARTRSQLR